MIVKILYIIILVLEARVLYLSAKARGWMVFVFYTQLSNMAATISAILAMLFSATPMIILLRYISSCMLVMTFFVTTCILVPMGGSVKMLLFSEIGFYLHVVIPILSVGSYLALEDHVSSDACILLSTVLTFIYGMIMLYLNHKGVVDGPYPFFKVRKQTAGTTVLWMSALTCVIALISFAVFKLSV